MNEKGIKPPYLESSMTIKTHAEINFVAGPLGMLLLRMMIYPCHLAGYG